MLRIEALGRRHIGTGRVSDGRNRKGLMAQMHEANDLGSVWWRWAHFVFTYKRPFLFHFKMGDQNGCLATLKVINLPFQIQP